MSNTIVTYGKILSVIFVVFCSSCSMKPFNKVIIQHNELFGITDYIYYTSVDTGYIVTHVGHLFDSVYCSYVYQTIDGGSYWELTDSLPNYMFAEPYTTYNNIIYGYVLDGSQSKGFWNSYLCMIDLKNHRHKVHNVIIHGPGYIICSDSTILANVYIDSAKYFLRLDYGLDNISVVRDTLSSAIKDVSYSDSSFIFLTYDKKLYFFKPPESYVYSINKSSSRVLMSGNDYYIAYWGDEVHDAGIYRNSYLSVCYDTLSYPSGYHVIDFLKTTNDSIIITYARKKLFSPFEDIVYSTDKGISWKIITLPPFVFPKYGCYCEPYLIYAAPNSANTIVRWNLAK